MELSLKELLQITCFICISTASKAQDQPSGSIVSGDYLFETFDKRENYQEAKDYCSARGQWLAEPKTAILNADLTSILNTSYTGYYIGLKRSQEDWLWVTDNSLIGYDNWATSHPGTYQYANIISADGEWKGLASTTPRAFICQSSAPCSTNKNPCLHDGTCTSMNTSPYYTCDCSGTGYYGLTCEDQPSGTKVSGEYIFKAFAKEGNYQAAKDFCSTTGQWPAEPKTASLNDDLATILDPSYSDYYFIGLKQHQTDEWLWEADGSPLIGYDNWFPGHPGSHECANIKSADGIWYGLPCATSRAFICQSYNPTGSKVSGGYLFEAFDKEGNHQAAKDFCSARGQWPAEPKTASLNADLTTILDTKYEAYHIGLMKSLVGVWSWETGGSLDDDDYNNWLPPHPGNHNCTRILSADGEWKGVSCADSRAFICQSCASAPCSTVPCRNGGTCTSMNTWPCYICDCSGTEYYGDTCEGDYCAENPGACNGGTCTSQTDDPHYSCNCVNTGFYGYDCEKDYCAENMNTCKNGGKCTSQTNDPHYSCNCANTGFYGYNCEKDYCAENMNTCKNGGTCTSQTDYPHYSCNCSNTGFYGTTCTVEYCDYPAHNGTCQNGAPCNSHPDDSPYYKCPCTPEYKGVNCTDPFFYQDGECKYHINDNSLRRTTFDLANQACNDLDGILFMDKDSTAHEFVADKLYRSYDKETINCWIGGQKIDSEWQWLDTTTVPLTDESGYSNWKGNEPNGTGSCMEIAGEMIDYEWSGLTCDLSKGFICEIPVEVPCKEDTCTNGNCIPTGCKWRCICDAGYCAKRCDQNLIEISSPNQVIAIEGDSKVIQVSATIYDNNPVTIEVYKDGVLDNSTTKMDVKSGLLNFTFISINEASEGKYEFIAFPDTKMYDRKTTTEMVIHVRARIDEVNPEFIFSPVTNGLSEVTCQAYGVPVPNIGWYMGDELVATSSDGVYQTKTNNPPESILHIENAVLSDDGDYTCKANNEVGEGTATEIVDVTVSITLEVYGSPTILSAIAEHCTDDGKITIEWEPNNQTIEIPHRFTITSINATSAYNESRDVMYAETHEFDFTSLENSTEYEISVNVRPDEVISKLFDTTRVTTGHGTPGAVTSLTITKESETRCIVKWEYPASPEDQIKGFQVTRTESYSYVPPGVEDEKIVTSNSTQPGIIEYEIEMVPNRIYTATVAAKTCAGYGDVEDVSRCKTDNKEPEVVPEAIIPDAGGERSETRKATITLAKETNGPISCIFVIISKSEPLSKGSPVTEQDILDYEARAKNKNNLEQGYLALAIPYPRGPTTPDILNITLGDSSTTDCNRLTAVSTGRNGAEEGVTKGNNIKLEVNAIPYYFTTITATPTENGTAYAQAIVQPFINGNIVAVVVPAVVVPIIVLIALAGAYIYMKRYKAPKDPDMPLRQTTNMAGKHAIEEQFYENVSRKIASKQNKRIPLDRLQQEYMSLKKDESMRFREEYQELRKTAKENAPPVGVGATEQLMMKNRYKNIIPYDHSKVGWEEKGRTVYINASYVHGGRFIAAQGPLPNTLNDFWTMIVEQQCKIIVMLTRCKESEKPKCEKYWPDLNRAVQYGAFNIRNHDEKYYGGYVRRQLKIYSLNNEEHVVEQYQFLKWPDHGVPKTTSSFFRLHRDVMAAQSRLRSKSKSPILVHCSAGVGRTGTFIGYDILLEECRKKNYVDIYGCVVDMRKDRVDLVQTSDQYELLHKLLLETYLFGETDVNEADFDKRMKKDKRALEKEFENLERAESFNASRKNDDASYSAGRSDRVVILRQPEDTEWITIDATFLDSYDDRKTLIAAVAPQKATVEYFWRAIWDNDIGTVVMLNNLSENQDIQCTEYWPKSKQVALVFSSLSVRLESEHDLRGNVERTFRLTRKNEEPKVVKQYQFLRWSPQQAAGITDVLDSLDNAHRRSSRVLIHCRNGLGRSGVFCALVNIADRIKQEKRVDVFRAVKDLRDLRPGMVQTREEYRFCYDVASALIALKNESVYENEAMVEEDSAEPIYQNV